MDTRAVGLAIVALGGGRARPGDAVDARVGLAHVLALGTPVVRGQPLAIVHAAGEPAADAALRELAAAITVADAATPSALVLSTLDA
jgi:thymidine phosphorylase